jgi:hypothetical protein
MYRHGVAGDYAPASRTGSLYPVTRKSNPFCLAFGAFAANAKIRDRPVSPIAGADLTAAHGADTSPS